MIENKLVWIPFMTNYKLSKDMGVANQYMVNPGYSHWIAMKCISIMPFLEVSCM